MTDNTPPGQDDNINVFDEQIEPCSSDPVTGFYRDGCCNTGKGDHGSHTVCVMLTDEFLQFSKSKGNDLTTPMPAYGFPGLKEGDRWCLCASRWLEAQQANAAPRVYLRSTHKKALEIIPMSVLKTHATDLN